MLDGLERNRFLKMTIVETLMEEVIKLNYVREN